MKYHTLFLPVALKILSTITLLSAVQAAQRDVTLNYSPKEVKGTQSCVCKFFDSVALCVGEFEITVPRQRCNFVK